MRRRLTEAQRTEVALRYAAGELVSKIAKEFDVTAANVSYHGRSTGVPARPCPHIKLTTEQRVEVEQQILEGVKYSAIGSDFGVHVSRVGQIALKMGIRKRPFFHRKKKRSKNKWESQQIR